jgi:hypothetical protein
LGWAKKGVGSSQGGEGEDPPAEVRYKKCENIIKPHSMEKSFRMKVQQNEERATITLPAPTSKNMQGHFKRRGGCRLIAKVDGTFADIPKEMKMKIYAHAKNMSKGGNKSLYEKLSQFVCCSVTLYNQ